MTEPSPPAPPQSLQRPAVLYSVAPQAADAVVEIATQLATHDVDAAACAALVFIGGTFADEQREIAQALADILDPIPFMGMVGASAMAGLAIDETHPAICVLLIPDASPTLRLSGPENLSSHLAATLLADAPEGRARILTVSPHVEDLASFLAAFDDGPDALGGLCLGEHGPFGSGVKDADAALLSLASYRWITAVSSATAALGTFHEVTKCDGNLLLELDGRPAADVLFADLAEHGIHPQGSGGRSLAVFFEATSEIYDAQTSGAVVGIDPQTRGMRVSSPVARTDHFRFATVNPKAARADLETALFELNASLGDKVPACVLVFSCIERDERLLGSPLYDMGRVADTFADRPVPVVGVTLGGEIATLGMRPELLSYSCVVGALIPESAFAADSPTTSTDD